MVVVLLLILVLTIWICVSPFYWSNKGIAWEIPMPIFGSFFGFLYKYPNVWWLDFYNKWKKEKIIGIHLFSKPCLVIKEPDIVVKMFGVDSNHFASRGWYLNSKYDPMGMSILFTEEQAHQLTKARLSPYFSISRAKGAISILKTSFDKADKIIQNNLAIGKPVDIYEIGIRVSTYFISSFVYGIDTDSLETKDSFFYKIQSSFNSVKVNLILLIGTIYPKLIDIFKFTFCEEAIMKELKKMIKEIYDQRMIGIGVRDDLFQGMVEILEKKKTGSEKLDDENNFIDFDEFWVFGQLLSVFIAGTEAISNTIAFLIYELARNPDIQEKVRCEMKSVFGNREFDHSLLNELKYTDMVINEVLRLYPQLPILPRKCTKDYEIDGFKIKEGTIIQIPVEGFHTDPDYFPEPYLFNPERFSPKNITNIVKGSFLPYGVGTQICLGMKFSKIELLYAVYRTVLKYNLSLNKATEVPLKVNLKKLVRTPLNKVLINMELRE